jgi:hypothetical protein
MKRQLVLGVLLISPLCRFAVLADDKPPAVQKKEVRLDAKDVAKAQARYEEALKDIEGAKRAITEAEKKNLFIDDAKALFSEIAPLAEAAEPLSKLGNNELLEKSENFASFLETENRIISFSDAARMLADKAPKLAAGKPGKSASRDLKKLVLEIEAAEQAERDASALAKDTAAAKKVLTLLRKLYRDTQAILDTPTRKVDDWPLRLKRISVLSGVAQKIANSSPKIMGKEATMHEEGALSCPFMDDRCLQLKKLGPPDWPPNWQSDSGNFETLRLRIEDPTAYITSSQCWDSRTREFVLQNGPQKVEWRWNTGQPGEGWTVAIFAAQIIGDDIMMNVRSPQDRDIFLSNACKAGGTIDTSLKLRYIGNQRLSLQDYNQMYYGEYENGRRLTGMFGTEGLERIMKAQAYAPPFTFENLLLDQHFREALEQITATETKAASFLNSLPEAQKREIAIASNDVLWKMQALVSYAKAISGVSKTNDAKQLRKDSEALRKDFNERLWKNYDETLKGLEDISKRVQDFFKTRLSDAEKETVRNATKGALRTVTLLEYLKTASKVVATEESRSILKGYEAVLKNMNEKLEQNLMILYQKKNQNSEVVIECGAIVFPFILFTGTQQPANIEIGIKLFVKRESGETQLATVKRPQRLDDPSVNDGFYLARLVRDYLTHWSLAPMYPLFFDGKNEGNQNLIGPGGHEVKPGGFLMDPGSYRLEFTVLDKVTGRTVAGSVDFSIVEKGERKLQVR